MKKVIKITSYCVLVFLASSIVQGQKRSIKHSASKSAASVQRSFCKGESVPSGFVVVGYKSSTKCGENSELIVKKPADTEIVCDGSPIPDGYHVVSQEGSRACASANANPLTNALSIARDGTTSIIAKSSTIPASDDEEDDRPSRTRVIVTVGRGGSVEDQQPKSALQQRADEEQRKAKLQLAVNNHQIMVGMTTEQVRESWGNPSDIHSITSSGYGRSETWYYQRGYKIALLDFENGILKSWSY